MADHTDLIKFWCLLCELDWDVWGTERADGSFILEDPRNECPGCGRPGRPFRPDSLS